MLVFQLIKPFYFSNKINSISAHSFSSLVKCFQNNNKNNTDRSTNLFYSTESMTTTTTSAISEREAISVDQEFLFKWDENAEELADNENEFKYGELINCRILETYHNSKTRYTVTNRLIKLTPGGVFRSRIIDIFHEHIRRMKSFTFKDVRYDFKRPSLYEYVTLKVIMILIWNIKKTLKPHSFTFGKIKNFQIRFWDNVCFNFNKEQQAVSSHYSIIVLVPLLLELEKNSRVLECGTGSGSMTLFLSERLGQAGLLHTFDFTTNKQRNAAHYFAEWKRSYDLRASHVEKWPSNVRFGCMNFNDPIGSPLLPRYRNFYDAIYLDMAEIHVAMARAYELMRPGACLVINCMHLTQVLKCMNVIERARLALETELLIEPFNRFWETRRITKRPRKDSVSENSSPTYDELDWVLRLEDRFGEKYKRGGLFFNYWQGFLVKFRKIK